MLGEIYSANLIKEKGGGDVKDGNSCNEYIYSYTLICLEDLLLVDWLRLLGVFMYDIYQ